MLRAYKYRIYPTALQAKAIEQTFAASRLVYNLSLDVKKRAWEQRINLSKFDIDKQLPELKKEFTWLKEVNSQALVSAIDHMDTAYKNFFRTKQGFPNYKSKRGAQSFQAAQFSKIDFDKQLLTILKIPNIPIVLHRTFEGKIKTVTISRTPSGKYFASILVDNGIALPQRKDIDPQTSIGLDLGIKDFVILSDGTKFENPKFLRNSLTRLKVLQRRVSRKKKGSSNRKKAVKRLAKYHEKIANRRKDYLNNVSANIIGDSQANTIYIEDLAVKNMVKNHRLAQAISDVGWGEFVHMLQYKAEWAGKNVIQINRFEPSSKTCSNCGNINNDLTLNVREWVCSCGAVHDRDINAAINIRNIGLKKSGRCNPGEPVESLALARA